MYTVASREDGENVASLLLSCGAAVDARSSNKSTPLHFGVEWATATDVLLRHGAEVAVCDTDLLTPLQHAILARKFESVVQLLLSSSPRGFHV